MRSIVYCNTYSKWQLIWTGVGFRYRTVLRRYSFRIPGMCTGAKGWLSPRNALQRAMGLGPRECLNNGASDGRLIAGLPGYYRLAEVLRTLVGSSDQVLSRAWLLLAFWMAFWVYDYMTLAMAVATWISMTTLGLMAGNAAPWQGPWRSVQEFLGVEVEVWGRGFWQGGICATSDDVVAVDGTGDRVRTMRIQRELAPGEKYQKAWRSAFWYAPSGF